MKEKKLLQATIKKLRDSEDIAEVREFHLSMIKHAIMSSFDGLGTVNLELQLLKFRDSLPADKRSVRSEAPKEKKPIEMFHIPKGALDSEDSLLGSGPPGAQPGAPFASPSVVQSYQDSGK